MLPFSYFLFCSCALKNKFSVLLLLSLVLLVFSVFVFVLGLDTRGPLGLSLLVARYPRPFIVFVVASCSFLFLSIALGLELAHCSLSSLFM
jgi:hypothetical protein